MEIDKTALLEYLEGFISENRKQRFLDVLKNRTKHFTIATVKKLLIIIIVFFGHVGKYFYNYCATGIYCDKQQG